jgi:hypothetical protein
MDFRFLDFLTSSYFVLPWYAAGLLASLWILRDEVVVNKNVNPALKAGWPVITVFFSVIGLIFYLWSCRPPGIAGKTAEESKEVHHRYTRVKWKRVLGSVIHCVAGDGLGIMTAMAISRIIGMRFWPEFWFEYAAGFVFGWFIFQYLAMRKMGNPPLKALWKGGRAEFFSMITLMVGMGIVMRFITPAVMETAATPDTAAFWGFAVLGLLVGTIFTYPMNWWLVSIGWKHGMS